MDRMDRMSKLLLQELTMIIQQKIEDPMLRSITITRMDVTRDLRLAKVFFVASSENEDNIDQVIKGLRRVAKFLRGELAHRMSMKYTPRLSFREDKTAQEQRIVDELFERIESELGIEKNTDEEGLEHEE